MSTTHKYYELARRAHYNMSFTPEKRAESFCTGFDADIANLQAAGVPQAKIDRYEALVVRHMQVKSRCLSSMITGPANFPVARAEKANRAEHTASLASTAYYDKIMKEAKQEAYYAANPEARPVMSGDDDAVERLKLKFASLLETSKKMVAVNKLLRKQPLDRAALIALLGTEQRVDDILKPDCFGGIGFASYQLSSVRNSIKCAEQRIAEIEKRKATKPKDFVVNGVRCFENTETMRLQLFFEGKPPSLMIATLKSHGFKWAPSVQAWQRLLNNNCIYAFNNWILPALKAA